MSTAIERVTLDDVAREAEVSLATVDRVLNNRPGVREGTATRVRQAMEKLGYRVDPLAARLARGSSFRFCFILPAGTNPFMAALGQQVEATAEWLYGQRASAEIRQVDVFDPVVLAAALDSLGTIYQGVAVVAYDDPLVRAAIDDLVRSGVAVVTLVSDVPSSKRQHYVGINNTAAGRTAGSLMGRFLAGRRGKVGVIVGSLGLRDHMERQFGFSQVLSGEYPSVELLPVVQGRDNTEMTKAAAAALLKSHPDLVGLYNVGGGTRGLGAALEESGRAQDLVVIGHELTEPARRYLLHGVFDAVINQNPGHEARSAARVLLAHCLAEPLVAEQEQIRIDIFLRDNLP
ncbi:LacI family DNA-binding transcriptional regulator [Lutibaculum baratangense]|nr:LacI family DNA-binding transcriptional regulator [Lutibaculum baratangense]